MKSEEAGREYGFNQPIWPSGSKFSPVRIQNSPATGEWASANDSPPVPVDKCDNVLLYLHELSGWCLRQLS